MRVPAEHTEEWLKWRLDNATIWNQVIRRLECKLHIEKPYYVSTCGTQVCQTHSVKSLPWSNERV